MNTEKKLRSVDPAGGKKRLVPLVCLEFNHAFETRGNRSMDAVDCASERTRKNAEAVLKPQMQWAGLAWFDLFWIGCVWFGLAWLGWFWFGPGIVSCSGHTDGVGCFA